MYDLVSLIMLSIFVMVILSYVLGFWNILDLFFCIFFDSLGWRDKATFSVRLHTVSLHRRPHPKSLFRFCGPLKSLSYPTCFLFSL